MVGVSSPPGMLKSTGNSWNFLMWAALDTTLLFVRSTHSEIRAITFGFVTASSEVLKSSPRLVLK